MIKQPSHPFFKPFLNKSEYLAVQNFLADPVIYGKNVGIFETNLSSLFQNRQCLAVKSGTLALHLALLSLQIKPGEEIIVSDVICEGVLNAIEQVGAKPVLADIEIQTANINPNLIPSLITPQTKCIIAAHYGGIPCKIAEIASIAKQYQLPLIEDCAQALGSSYNNNLCGHYGDISIFSFYANKILTSGEGGAIIAKSETIKKLKELTFTSKELAYEWSPNNHLSHLQYDYLMDDLTAIIGITQLSKLKTILRKRKKIFNKYNFLLKKIPTISLSQLPANLHPSYYQYTIQLPDHHNVNYLIEQFRQNKIIIHPDFIPNHKRKFYREKYKLLDKNFPVASELMSKRFCLPLFPEMPEKYVNHVVKICKKIL